MAVSAKLNYLRIAPRKVRLLADLIRGKTVKEARLILGFAIKKGASPLLKLLNQAVASAVNNFQLDPANLYISKITVDGGSKYKRWRPRARGQAYEIQKKTSHVTLVLDEKIKARKKVKKVEKTKIPPKEISEEDKSSSRPFANARVAEVKQRVKPKIEKPRPEMEISKPSIEKGIKRIFRRKAL